MGTGLLNYIINELVCMVSAEQCLGHTSTKGVLLLLIVFSLDEATWRLVHQTKDRVETKAEETQECCLNPCHQPVPGLLLPGKPQGSVQVLAEETFVFTEEHCEAWAGAALSNSSLVLVS